MFADKRFVGKLLVDKWFANRLFADEQFANVQLVNRLLIEKLFEEKLFEARLFTDKLFMNRTSNKPTVYNCLFEYKSSFIINSNIIVAEPFPNISRLTLSRYEQPKAVA